MYIKPKNVFGPHLHPKNSQLGPKMPQNDPQKAKKKDKQAEAELGQAQEKLGLKVIFGFLNFSFFAFLG